MCPKYALTEEQRYVLTLPFDFAYYCKLRSSFESKSEAESCGFCHIDRKINKVVFENEHWLIWENSFKGTRPCKTMLVIVSREHLRTLEDITDMWPAFGEMVTWACKNYDLPGGMMFLRFGPLSSNTGTMAHLHWNIWIPDKSIKGDARKLWIPIQKTEQEEQDDRERTNEYARRYETGERQ